MRTTWLPLIAVAASCGAREAAIAPEPRAHATGPTTTAATPVPGLRLPDGAVPLAYDIRLELDPDRDTFTGHAELRVRLDRPAEQIWLHGVELEITSAGYRSNARSGELTRVRTHHATMLSYSFGTRLPAGEVTLAFAYRGHVGGENEGLFRQRAGGQWFVYAQSESMFARRILPCFDEPRFKPAWHVRLVVPAKQIALGNGAIVAQTTLADGRREVELAEVRGMPSYLFSVAVGPFAFVDAGRVGRAQIPARVAVAPGDVRNASVAAHKLPAIVTALERYFDRPLPVAKLDLVAVPYFFGAMENVGLVTFDRAVLVGDARRAPHARRFVKFAAHELAHQWFGNLVTPAWWDDLWLSEGLTTWLGEKIAVELAAYPDPALRAQITRLQAVEADSAAEPRAIRREVTSTDDVEDRFDAISYDKASVVLAMFERTIGGEPLRDALRRYVEHHAGGAATTADLLAVLPGRAGQALAGYLARPGVPVVDVTVACTGTPAVELATRDRWIVPVCVRTPGGPTCTLVDGRATIPVASCPAWVIGNAGGDGYYRVAAPLAERTAPLTAAERLAYGDDVAAALVRGDVALADALSELRTLTTRRDPIGDRAALSIAAVIDPAVDDALRPAWAAYLAKRFAHRLPRLMMPATALDYDIADQLVPLVADRAGAAVAQQARGVVDRALARGERPPELALVLAAPRGGRPLFDRVVVTAREAPEPEQHDLIEALGSFGPELAPRLVELVASGTLAPDTGGPALAAMLARPATRTAIWRAVRDRAALLLPRFVPAQVDDLIRATAPLCDRTARDEVAATFAGRGTDEGKAILTAALAAIDRCIARRGKLADLRAQLARP
ncbi:MAG TPA: M1 family metallopeptidase [Kofleriaceae bacterium]|nr:M1 family metallopeptidase [Kofleriaceae bacterium]